jgi:hypothetical protein
VFLAMVLALLATACFKADMAVRVEEDGSGEVGWLIALDTEAVVGLGSAFATEDAPEMSIDEACADFRDQQEVPDGAVVVPYEEDGFCGLRYTMQFEPGGFEQVLADSDTEVGSVELRADNGGWYFELSDPGGMTGEADSADQFGAELLDDAEFTIRVFLPGRLVDHNATYVDTDGTAVWEIDLEAETTRIFARTEPGPTVGGSGASSGGGGSGGIVAIVVVAGLAGAAALAWFVVRRRKSAADPSDPSASNLPLPPPASNLPPPSPPAL